MGTTHNKNSHISSPLPTLRRRKRSNAENRATLFCWKGLWKHPFFLSPPNKTLLASPRLFRGSCVTPMWKHCLNGTGSSAKYFRVHSKAPDIFFFFFMWMTFEELSCQNTDRVGWMTKGRRNQTTCNSAVTDLSRIRLSLCLKWKARQEK